MEQTDQVTMRTLTWEMSENTCVMISITLLSALREHSAELHMSWLANKHCLNVVFRMPEKKIGEADIADNVDAMVKALIHDVGKDFKDAGLEP